MIDLIFFFLFFADAKSKLYWYLKYEAVQFYCNWSELLRSSFIVVSFLVFETSSCLLAILFLGLSLFD